MATTAQAGIFGFGPQSGKEAAATQFWKHKATTVDLGVLDDIRVGPLEIGSGPFPTFPYKAGYIVGGGVEMQPRLEDSLGWLLFAHLGDHAVGAAVDGVYPHTFKPYAADQSYVRWLSLRKYIPPKEGDANTDLGELYIDCKPTNLTLNLPNDAPLTARWDFMGRTFQLVPDISGWSWQNAAYEDWGSIPVGCETGGSIEFTGGELSGESMEVVNARVSFSNQNLDIRQEKVFGSPALGDITIIGRQLTFDVMIKYDIAVYRNILTLLSSGTDWASRPLTGSVAIKTVATALAGTSTTQKFELDIDASNVMWQMNGPIQLAAGQAVMQRLTGTVLEPTSGDYATFKLYNEVADYTWPVAAS